MKLYGYWRSSCSYRVRIVLATKGLSWEDVPVYNRGRLLTGNVIPGPAIVEQEDSTTLVSKGWTAEVHESGTLVITRGDDAV